MNRVVVALLSVIALGVLTIAGLLAYGTLVGEPTEPEARVVIRTGFTDSAESYCALSGVPGLTDFDDPRYQNCVDREVQTDLQEWDADHPDMAWNDLTGEPE